MNSTELAACPNCGAPRPEAFCSKCGQNDRCYAGSLWRVVGDVAKEVFETDGRTLATLRSLLLRPGELAIEFSRNRRASYVSPVRTYLFASIVFFGVLALNFGPERPPTEKWGELAASGKMPRGCETADVAAFELWLPPADRHKVGEILARAGPGMGFVREWLCGLMDLVAESPEVSGPVPLAAEQQPRPALVFGVRAAVDILHDPLGARDSFVGNLGLATLVTLPAYALLLKLFFFGARRFYTEHLVFAIYLHVFTYLAYAVGLLLPDAPGDAAPAGAERWLGEAASWLGFAIICWSGIYAFLAMRRYYGNGRFRTACKWLALGVCYLVLLIPGLLLSLGATLFQL